MAELEGKTILVVEDNKTINRQLSAILSKHGAIVMRASNGLEAIEKAKGKPDLILMDIQMPEMNGFEATMAIKGMDGLHSIPIIMLTGNKEEEDVEQGMRCGARAYITKPALAKVIVETILENL